MTLMSWLHSLLHPDARSSERFEEAMHATEDFTASVRSVHQQIRPYALDRDPFAAIAAAQLYEEEQERRIHEGPPH